MSEISYYTQEGLENLKQEIKHLETVERPKISQQIGEARDKGDLSANAEYDAAKEAQGMLEARIAKLKNTLKSTSFENLKKNEIEKGFSEAVTSNKDNNKKISFFHLGPKNDWRKILNKELKMKLDETFEKELKELSYL